MVRAADTVSLEDQVGLGVFVGKRIGRNAVVFEELLNLHGQA
jgi:hypothetical protein